MELACWGSKTIQLQPVVAPEFLPKVNTGQSMKASSLLLLPASNSNHFILDFSPGCFFCAPSRRYLPTFNSSFFYR